MSELLQSGQFPGASGYHPDADQISAFVEQALPAHEREQVLAHLAVCADCRQTVALSLPQLEAPPAHEPAPKSEPKSWPRGWSIFVPAALALAASVFLVVYVRHNNTKSAIPAQPAQIATSQSPLPIAPPPQAPASSAPAPESRSRTANPVAALAPKPIARQQLDALAVAPQAAPSAPPAAAAEDKKETADSMHGSALGQIAPAPAAAQPPSVNAPLAPVTQSVDVAGEPPQLSTMSAALEMRAVAPISQPIVLKHPLPSGLAALAAAASGRAMLAIDTHNSVFVSNDSGEHWTAVPATWQGRVVNVSLVSRGAVFGSAAGGSGLAFAGAMERSPAAGTSLTGVITDVSGAVIPGASVTIRDAATSASRTITTDANGRYLAGSLTPGSYNIEATAPGFMTQHAAGVVLQASTQTAENLTLQVGSASETVSVQAETQPTASPRAAKSKALKSASPSIAPQAIFRITTDTGEHWTSADGIVWQRE
jgi:hypothetical protein